MLVHFKPKIVALLIAGLSVSSPLMAAKSASLEQTVDQLQKEVASLKQQVQSNKSGIESNKSSITVVKKQRTYGSGYGDNFMPFDPDLPGKALVSTGPYNGIELSFSGSNLIVNSPSVNTDVQLLGIRKQILKQIHENQEKILGETSEIDHPHLLFSGVIESQAGYVKRGGAPSTSDIDVTNVSLDATIFGPTDWLLGFVEFSYDNGAPFGSVFTATSNYRTANSRLYVNKAFVTVGNLSATPFYTTFGQFYVPFGRYSSVMVSDTLTKLLTRTKARSILVGYQQDGDNALYASTYIFRGDSYRGSVGKVANGGLNLGYRFNAGMFHGDIGGGVIGNIADSGGMQAGTGFQNFERIDHRVPGYNARAVVSVGEHVDLIGEYVTASTEFNRMDMSYNNHGAKPSAFDLEAAYTFTLFGDKPSSLGIGYGKSNEALALGGVPLTRTSLVFNTSLLRNTLQSIEFRRDREYAASDVATGAGGAALSPIKQTGKVNNAVTAQFDFYF